jgi:hypothetical protein
MAAQTDIKPGKPRVRGVNSQFSGLLDVEIPLTPQPDRYWTEIFNRGPSDVPFSLSMHPPHLYGSTVKITPPDSEVEKYVEYISARVEGTNRNYADRIEPRLRAQKEAEEREAEDRKRRIEEAQKRVDDAA